MTPKQKELAAKIIEEGRITLNRDSSPDYLSAAAFVFDYGVLYLPPEGRAEVVALLRKDI